MAGKKYLLAVETKSSFWALHLMFWFSERVCLFMYVITLVSGSLSVRVRSSSRRLVQASRWLSEVRLMK